MGEATPPLAAETEALRQAYAALNRNDIPGFVQVFDPQVERTHDFAEDETYHGLAAVTEHTSRARETWAEGSCEPQRFIANGDKVIVFAQVRVKLKHEKEWREGLTADVFTFRNGKAVQMRTFVDRRKALQWAGVDAPDAI
jgi:ketosteroid isomerase-like protein